MTRDEHQWRNTRANTPALRRLLNGTLTAARIDGGYCLDAPEEIPGGGMHSECVRMQDEPDEWIGQQRTIEREP